MDAERHLFPVVRKGKWGAIDSRGEVVIEPRYEGLWNLSGGLLGFSDGRRGGLMDTAGRVVRDQGPYDEIREFRQGRAVVRLGKKFGYIDRDFREVVPPRFDFAYEFGDGLAFVEQGKWRGYIAPNGETLFELPAGMRGDVFSGGRAMVVARNKRGYIDRAGELVIPTRFVDGRRFSEGSAAVSLSLGQEGRVGFIDERGEFVFEPDL
ncbi:MAG: WG repeat-containing protein [Isosphaeraceae bacterium]